MWYKGICHYALGEFDKAKELFDKVASLDNDKINVLRAQMWKEAAIISEKGDSQSNEDWNRLFASVSQPIGIETLFLSLLEDKYKESDITAYTSNAENDVFAKRSLIGLCALNNDLDKARELLADIDLDKPVETIPIEGNSSIQLYDPFLLKAFSIMAYTQAKIHFKEVVAAGWKKKNMHPGYWLGRCYLELGQLPDAITILNKEEKYIQASIYLGEAYWKNGENIKAREIWKKQEKEGKEPILLRKLARTYVKLNINLDDAEALARKALKLKQNENRHRIVLQPYYGCLGFVLFQKNRIENAIEEYGNGFLFDQKHTLESNDPEFTLYYSKAIFIPNVLSYDLVNQSMLTLSKAYKGVIQLRNAMSGIYSIRFKNMDGGKVRDGM